MYLSLRPDQAPAAWLPWCSTEAVPRPVCKWLEAIFSAAWEVAISREARDLGYDRLLGNASIFEALWDRAPAVSFEVVPKGASFLTDRKAKDLGLPQLLPWSLVRWTLAAFANSIRWSDQFATHPRGIGILTSWARANSSPFKPIKVKASFGTDHAKIEVMNACTEEALRLSHGLKEGGTPGVLRAVARELGSKESDSVFARMESASLNEEFVKEEFAWVASIRFRMGLLSNS